MSTLQEIYELGFDDGRRNVVSPVDKLTYAETVAYWEGHDEATNERLADKEKD
jgi:hypothetical protein